jgi:hypothetical protein
MNINEKTLKAFGLLNNGEQLQKKRWATETRYISKHIGIRHVLEDDGRWSLNIVIDEHATHEEIKSSWRNILEEREKLARLQGHDSDEYFRAILYDLSNNQYIGSYQMLKQENSVENRPVYIKAQPNHLAMDINFDLLVYIIRISKTAQDKERAKLAKIYLESLLQAFSYSQEYINGLIDAALVDLNNGRGPFNIINDPILESKMREKIRYIKNKDSATQGNQSSPEAKQVVLSIHKWFLIWGDWEEGRKLLSKSYPETFSQYQDRLYARISEILLAKI